MYISITSGYSIQARQSLYILFCVPYCLLDSEPCVNIKLGTLFNLIICLKTYSENRQLAGIKILAFKLTHKLQ